MLKGILAIAGQPGLFKIVSEGKNNVIVESLITGKKMPAYASAKISSLEDIAVYTEEGDMPLGEVFQAIKEKAGEEAAVSHKASANDIKAFFMDALPTYDEDRVYVSDMKKILQWYNLLHKHDMLNFDADETAEETTED